MRILICDDIKEQLALIQSATEEYFQSHEKISYVIQTYDNAFDFLDAYKTEKSSLVLLDICMPGILGIDIAREIRKMMDDTEIVFLSSSKEFVLDAFDVNATHYLIKPFTKEAFHEAIDRAMKNIDLKSHQLIYLKCPKGIIKSMDKNSIVYIESSLHRQTVYLVDGSTIETVQTLTTLFHSLDEVSPGQFISPYKGYIVNQYAIATIEKDFMLLKNGTHIPLARRTFNQIKQNYFDYMFVKR